ncbi:hypothetical protein [Novosphingobium sp. B1]|uniref:hypothetical protein n=1 Tax=Novosphingobium sp. B1 TaxID=1938756 RepID=UPI0009D7CFEF|nr:hypothetical protein [Novosphingobium sp. B1]SMC48580.1 hypothetical protein SAMN06272759_103240 [Novosphingobium sp. B1]
MIASANRLRSVGWLVLLGLCLALVLVLAFRVNALRSQIHHAEARIVALKQEKMYLETEFETRSNQQQLKAWNDVEFGYAAPSASQYLEGERQLASLSVPAAIDAPAPIRVASVDDSIIASAAFPAMVSPLSGKALSADDGAGEGTASAAAAKPKLQKAVARVDHDEAVETLQDRLGKVVDVRPKGPVRKETASEKEEAKPRKAEKVAKSAAKGTSAKADAGKTKPKVTAVADKSSAKKAKEAAPSRTTKGKEAKAAR